MPTPTKGKRLGGSPAHQKHILSNLATSLFEHGAITTTEAKARKLRPFAEKLISKARRDVLHNRRQVLSVVHDKTIVHVLFTEIGPRYADRPGGYTRITKIGPRKGDNAPMAVIELVEEEFTAKTRATTKATRTTKQTAVPESAVVANGTSVDEPVADGAAVDEALGVEDEPTEASETTDELVAPEPTETAAADPDDESLADPAQIEAQNAVAAQESQDEVPAVPAAGVADGDTSASDAASASVDPDDDNQVDPK